MEPIGELIHFLLLSLGALFVVLVVLKWVRYRWRSRSLHRELTAFLGRDPFELPIVSHTFQSVDLPNLQLALDQYHRRNGRNRLIG